MDTALRALNRFGLGARRGERRTIGDGRAWLRAQLDEGAPARPAPDGVGANEIAEALRALRRGAQGGEPERRNARRRIVEIANADARDALQARITSNRPFVERLVAFWSNHLCISIGSKFIVAPLAGSYERDVIRRHVLGRFEDMVLASAKHPAMLLYLDNFQSVGPSSRLVRAGQRRAAGQRRGLNENYARELLELHTLGVDGGYTQQDVQELAKILTGWTITGFGGPGDQLLRGLQPRRRGAGMRQRQAAAPGPIEFMFVDALHEPGAKTVLNERYGEAGIEEGERVIRALCRHPSTARFVATKLVRHFVSDEPPAAAVERVARVFRSTDGDLKAVARALVDEPEAWREDTRKFRTPQDWFVAVLRAFGAESTAPNTTNVLRQLRHQLWSPAAPKGFGDTLQEWADPDSLLNRAELARTMAAAAARRGLDPRSLAEVVEVPSGDPMHGMLADTSITAADRIALAIAGPSFQWR